MVAVLSDEVAERVGRFDMRVRFGDRTDESDARWRRRSDVLATWLMERWHLEQKRDSHCGNATVSSMTERN